MYGLQLLGVGCFTRSHYILGGILFSIVLNFKHIYLYQAPAYFVFLLSGYCFTGQRFSFMRLLLLGLSVITVFFISFGPFLTQIPQVLTRLFPFKRGLCHAYWAPNFWALYSVTDRILAKGIHVFIKYSENVDF
jgi:alpha-1,3-glucosyltransferase